MSQMKVATASVASLPPPPATANRATQCKVSMDGGKYGIIAPTQAEIEQLAEWIDQVAAVAHDVTGGNPGQGWPGCPPSKMADLLGIGAAYSCGPM